LTSSIVPAPAGTALGHYNRRMLVGLVAVALGMFGFGYAMVPMYKAICEALGVNVITRGDSNVEVGAKTVPANTQVDLARWVTVEFDANARGPWEFHPEKSSLRIHPGQMNTVIYEFRNPQSHAMTAQAIPSYAPGNAQSHFTKVECFCFQQHTLQPGESRRWPVTFYVDSQLPKDIGTITLSYTFFEVGSSTPAAPTGAKGGA
jgi:cytochrome c oxidase assembly protein subunit 11